MCLSISKFGITDMRCCGVVNSAAAFKCNVYRLMSLQTGNFDKSTIHWEGAQYVNIRRSVLRYSNNIIVNVFNAS